MSSSSSAPVLIGDSSLTGWQLIGSGGFGHIYRARHCQWCYDVAVKLLRYDDGSSSSLQRESEMMRRGSSEYIMQVLGVFKGRLPNSGPSEQLGLVMKFMERGSLTSLQATLNEVLPWPLVLRLAHQVSLGINFLHSLSPALLHLDLKPSNVLLDSYLNVKLTDFGLAKFYHSISRVSKRSSEEEGGTLSYMPPEAFDLQYSPTRASDIYSYGVLLWSIVTGKQPYANPISSIVRLRIPLGDRPSLEEFRRQAAGRAELSPLMELMVRCWESGPGNRPSAFDCATVTEQLYQMHKHNVLDVVHQVLRKLEQKEQERLTEQVRRLQVTQNSELVRVEAVNICDNVPTGRPPVQEMAGDWTNHRREAARVTDPPTPRTSDLRHVDQPRPSDLRHVDPLTPRPADLRHVDQPRPSDLRHVDPPTPRPADLRHVDQPRPSDLRHVDQPRPSDLRHVDPPTPRPADPRHVDQRRLATEFQEVKASSVHPIGASPPPPSTRGSSQGRAAENLQSTPRQHHLQYQRQSSSPVTSSHKPPSTRNVCIHWSNVSGVQSGDFNTMNIYDSERRRHPTAPPSVNLPPLSRPGSRNNNSKNTSED
uniref:Protein kinase domain-containing protein n=1 Tax=Scophthalmus maximus TaxID=52904 RepID=A0A8D3AUS0_SCOMX